MKILKLENGSVILNLHQLSSLVYKEDEKVGYIYMSDGTHYIWHDRFETVEDFKRWAMGVTGQKVIS